MTTKSRARELFARRDMLETEMQTINRELRELRAIYMREERVWGVDPVRFRKEIDQ